jgi:SNF2 family DNA or RNA helicase
MKLEDNLKIGHTESGQTKTVLYTDIICKNSLDERILSSLHQKDKLAIATMGDEFKNWLK